MTRRVTVSDLEWAIEWVESFDPGKTGDPISDLYEEERRDAVVAWIKAEVERRQDRAFDNAVIREMAAKTNQTEEQIRQHPRIKEFLKTARDSAAERRSS